MTTEETHVVQDLCDAHLDWSSYTSAHHANANTLSKMEMKGVLT